MNVETCFTPQGYPLFHKPNAIVVVIDILRATSAITTAFYNGVAKMIPVANLDDAKKYKEQGFMVAAERNGEIVEGYDLGNSPFGYMNSKVKNQTIVITTTNGTQAIEAAKIADQVIIGSFLNMDVITKHLKNENKDIIFLCAGWKNKFNLEDTLFAGALAESLVLKYGSDTVCDSTLAAIELYKNAKHNLYEFLGRSSHRNRLAKLDLERDIKYCLTPNQCPVIPTLKENFLIKL